MVKKKNAINSLQNNTDKNLINFKKLSQKNKELIAKELQGTTEGSKEKTQEFYIKKIKELEHIAQTLLQEIRNDQNKPEKFKYILMHDINSIRTSGEGLRSIIDSNDNNKVDEMIKTLEKRMIDIEKSIEEHYQIHDNIEPKLYPMNLETVLEEIKDIISINDIYRKYIQDTGIKFHIDVHQQIKFCVGASHGIFDNLLKNAIKAVSEQEKTIQSSDITISMKDNKISFHNYGVIPEKLQNQMLFDLGTTTTGTGIGLYSAKKWITTLGGSITFTSNEQEGTIFIITLPESMMIKK